MAYGTLQSWSTVILCNLAISIGGASYIYTYAFTENGTIISQEKTGEVVAFRR